MPIDAEQLTTVDLATVAAESPMWWFLRLSDRLKKRRAGYNRLQSYLDGENDVPRMSSRAARLAYQRLRDMSRTNFAELIVEAPRERMRPVGFRTGATGDDRADAEAWRIWQANSLDADSAIVHRTALALGRAYVIVGGVDPNLADVPVITPEDPREVIVEHHAVYRRSPLAALKLYRDQNTGRDAGYLFLPGEVYRFDARRGVQPLEGAQSSDPKMWTFNPDPVRVPDGLVPVVEFANKPDLKGAGRGEFEAHTSVLDRIDYQVLQRLEIATLQAFRQRAVSGVPNVDENGNEIDYTDIFAADPGALWLLPEAAKMWESGTVDLTPVKEAIKDDVRHLAAVTRTPLFYLSPDAASGSAEGASLAREGLVFRTEDRISQAGESWERVMSHAFRFMGDEARARVPDMEVLWAPVERFSLAERFDAAIKAQSAGVPWRAVMQDVLGFSPQQVDRMSADRALESILSGLEQRAGDAVTG